VPPAPPAGSSLLRRRRAEVVKRIAPGPGPSTEPAAGDGPLVLDEPLAELSGDELVAALDRLADDPRQVVYLTDDPAVADWARARSAGDRLTLMNFAG
jgi:hypothetical protein